MQVDFVTFVAIESIHDLYYNLFPEGCKVVSIVQAKNRKKQTGHSRLWFNSFEIEAVCRERAPITFRFSGMTNLPSKGN